MVTLVSSIADDATMPTACARVVRARARGVRIVRSVLAREVHGVCVCARVFYARVANKVRAAGDGPNLVVMWLRRQHRQGQL